jgi:hypothetical protein
VINIHLLARLDRKLSTSGTTVQGSQTLVGWREGFDTAAHKERIAGFVSEANEQNLSRLANEVLNVR